MRIDMTSGFTDLAIELAMLAAPLLDLIFKSGLIVLVACAACLIFGRPHHSSIRHLFWLCVLVSTFLIPILSTVNKPAASSDISEVTYEVVTVTLQPTEVKDFIAPLNSDASVPTISIDPTPVLIVMYFLGTLFLLARYLRDALKVLRISQRAEVSTRLSIVKKISELKQQQGITRPVQVKFSSEVTSPISFGLFKPVVIFPMIAQQWPEPTLRSALIHEFSHIARLDWLANAFGYLCCALFWINPLTWYALTRLNVEAENACDKSVLNSGVKNGIYAEYLLSIARSCRQAQQQHLFAQPILPSYELKTRLQLLLETDVGETEFTRMATPFPLIIFAGVIVLLSVGNILSTEIANGPNRSGSQLDQFIATNLAAEPLTLNSTMNEEPDSITGVSISAPVHSDIPEVIELDPSISNNSRRQDAVVNLDRNSSLIKDGQQFHAEESTVKLDLPGIPSLPELPVSVISGVTTVVASEQSRQGNRTIFELFPELEELSRSELRNEFEKVETEYYQVFNANVEDRSLHVICGEYTPAGTFIPERFCEPRFVTTARSEEHRQWTIHDGDLQPVPFRVGKLEPLFQRLTEAMNEVLQTNQQFRILNLKLRRLRSELDRSV